MGDVVRAVGGWVERMRDAVRTETVFVRSGVQGLMGGGLAQHARRRSVHLCRLRIRVPFSKPPRYTHCYLCVGYNVAGWGFTAGEAWMAWRSHLPWWCRWLVPRARAEKRRGHVPPRAVPPPPPSVFRKEHEAGPKPKGPPNVRFDPMAAPPRNT